MLLSSYFRSILDFITFRSFTSRIFGKLQPLREIENNPASHSQIHKMQDSVTVSYVTVPNSVMADKLARRIVQHRLAACVNIVKSVDSIYEWEGELEHDEEVMLIIKSHSSKSKELVEFVEKNHVYKCPEVITVKIENGSKKYLDWVLETVNKPPFGPDSPNESPKAE